MYMHSLSFMFAAGDPCFWPLTLIMSTSQAMKYEWRPDATRIIFHVADAPCHGSEFQLKDLSKRCKDVFNGLYGSGIPEGREDPEVEVKTAFDHFVREVKVHRYRLIML